ncbi:MAG TPA: hypothetical protein VIX91_15745 [Candidatus Acidoferrum sp.]
MPNRAIEIHDSILADISSLKSEVQLHFSSVYIHQSEGVPGRDAGSGWVQKAILHIYDANVEGAFLEFPVDLTDGQTQIGQKILDNEIPVPLNHKGPFALRLQAMWQEDRLVTFSGSCAELELLGEPEYVEEFRP